MEAIIKRKHQQLLQQKQQQGADVVTSHEQLGHPDNNKFILEHK